MEPNTQSEALAQVQNETQEELKPNEFRLRDGRKGCLREPLGKDVRDASRLVGKDGNETEMGMAMASLAASIEGVPVIYDDFLNMHMADCFTIVNKYNALQGK